MKNFILFIGMFCSIPSFAQNLVLNPSFEDYLVCPNLRNCTILLSYDSVPYWLALHSGGAYFNECGLADSIIWSPTLCNNFALCQEPQDGKGFIEVSTGVFSDRPPTPWPSDETHHSIVRGTLMKPLQVGHSYKVWYYANSLSGISCTSNNIA
jgi:hypothetical protein